MISSSVMLSFDLTFQRLYGHTSRAREGQGPKVQLISSLLSGTYHIQFSFLLLLILLLNFNLTHSNSEGHTNLLSFLRESEALMREETLNRSFVIPGLTNSEEVESECYRVESTGAVADLTYSVSLVHYYCSQLPGDRYQFSLTFYYFPILSNLSCYLFQNPTDTVL